VAVTGTLNADFSQFYTAVQKADVSLKGMEGGAVKVESAMTQMATTPLAPTNTFRESLGQVDQALAATGINVGKYGRGLAEIAEMSGKTVSQLGLLASGASAVAAAMAGWNIGRAIAEFTGLDAAVQKTWASLLGWETAAEGSASATAEFVKRIQEQNDAYAVSSERLAATQKEVRGLSDARIAEIAIAKQAGATTEEITRHFGISAEALKALAERQKLAGKAAEAHTQALEVQRAAVEKLDRDYDKLMSDTKNANQLAIMEAEGTRLAAEALDKKNTAAANWIAQQVKVKAGIDAEAAATAAYLTEQDALTAATDALGQAHFTAGVVAEAATDQAVAGYQGVAQAVTISGDAIKEWIRLMQYSAQVNAILHQNSLFTTTSQLEQIANLGGRGPAARGGASVSNVFNIVDTEANIAARVSARVTESVMRLGPV
jgi:phage host-nuclease inhibitor protein Gam